MLQDETKSWQPQPPKAAQMNCMHATPALRGQPSRIGMAVSNARARCRKGEGSRTVSVFSGNEWADERKMLIGIMTSIRL